MARFGRGLLLGIVGIYGVMSYGASQIHRWTAEALRELLSTPPLPLSAGSADAISGSVDLLMPKKLMVAPADVVAGPTACSNSSGGR